MYKILLTPPQLICIKQIWKRHASTYAAFIRSWASSRVAVSAQAQQGHARTQKQMGHSHQGWIASIMAQRGTYIHDAARCRCDTSTLPQCEFGFSQLRHARDYIILFRIQSGFINKIILFMQKKQNLHVILHSFLLDCILLYFVNYTEIQTKRRIYKRFHRKHNHGKQSTTLYKIP